MIRIMAVSIIVKTNIVTLSIVCFTIFFLFAVAITATETTIVMSQGAEKEVGKYQILTYSLLIFALRTYQARATTVM